MNPTSFLNLLPVMDWSCIDANHMETYGHDFSRLKGCVCGVLHPRLSMAWRFSVLPCATLCRRSLADRQLWLLRRSAEVWAVNIEDGDEQCISPSSAAMAVLPTWTSMLNLPGRHNVLNALSAIAVAVEL
jgi:UDP-N-acetylmuramate--alanine ligase